MSRPSKPPTEPSSWVPRRSEGGARTELTERVTLRSPGFETTGWTLNVSRGGVRAVVEERLVVDDEYEIVIGEGGAPRRVRAVWSQEEADGQIVGMKFLDVEGSAPPQEPPLAPGR